MNNAGGLSEVEEYFRHLSRDEGEYPGEKITTLAVDNFAILGELTALRFLEWCQNNPNGTVALPTGKTPEFFIKWVHYYRENWSREIKKGRPSQLTCFKKKFPDFRGLHFVQLDEFFPINPDHERSFSHFVRRYYLEGMGFDPDKALLIDTWNLYRGLQDIAKVHDNLESIFPDGKIDLNLRTNPASGDLEAIQKKTIACADQFCEEYESRIRALGGIGFFLGGIGPDGHIAFNVSGSSHHSATRLADINYQTMAVAASDLGGIESVRKKAVITIGLSTITSDPHCTAVIMAAGEAKANVVQRAVEEPVSLENPASCLQKIPGARFYLTRGAASSLKERNRQSLMKLKRVYTQEVEQLMVEGVFESGTPLRNPEPESRADAWDIASGITGKTVRQLQAIAQEKLTRKIKRGLKLPEGKTILHTAPHHDDIELAYFPLVHHLVRSGDIDNHFAYCTSGFTAVTDSYVLECIDHIKQWIVKSHFKSFASEGGGVDDENARLQEVTGFLKGVAGQDEEIRNNHVAARLVRKICGTLNNPSKTKLMNFISYCEKELETKAPGERDRQEIQMIKSWLREWEAELVWAHFGVTMDRVSHLRLNFYTGDIFPEYPDDRDIGPLMAKLEEVKPDIVTVAMDPEASGPDTHFKTLVAVARSLELYRQKYPDRKIRVWGYRNVWSTFQPSEVNTIIPVSLNSFAVLDSMFETCFTSQKSASFPSHEFDGTFSQLARKTWVNQYNDLVKITGADFFEKSNEPMLRRAFGAIYLKDMTWTEFLKEMRNMKSLLQSKKNLKALS